MSKKDTGGFVYPQRMVDHKLHLAEKDGISRRDWLAGLAMPSYIKIDFMPCEQVSRLAYEQADSMIERGNE